MPRERIFHQMPHVELEDWLRLGWMVVFDLPMPHAQWSVMGEWLCDCPVKTVKRR